MANPCKVMLPVALLILVATQGHCSQPVQEQAALVDSTRGISAQRESTDSLRDVVDNLTQEITNMKTQLEDRDKKVITLSEEIHDLQKKIRYNSEMVQEMNERFVESQYHVKQLEETVRQLNDMMKNQLKEGCEITPYRQYKHEIELLVREFSSTSNWPSLIKGLGTVLGHNDNVYHILKNMVYVKSPMFRIGADGHAQLVLLLLCAGLPVNFPDSDGDSMLHGAAEGGQLELVKLLVHHGADVNMRGNMFTPLQRARNSLMSDVVAYLEPLSH